MIQLRQMRADEFPQYVAYFVSDYSAELSSNYDLDKDTALAKAKDAVKEELGQGVDTADQVLLCATVKDGKDDRLVGYLWCKPDIKNRTVFINDFFVLPQYRGNGYGMAALIALENSFSESEFREIRLRVAYDNKSAERLYLRAGFMPTGINMRRAIRKT